MWQTEATIDIGAPPTKVFEYLADLRSHKEWSSGVAEIVQIKGEAITVGAEFEAREVVPMKFKSFSRITRLEAPLHIEWKAWDGRMFEVDWAFDIEPLGASTRLVQRAQFRPENAVARVLLAALRKRQIPKENARSLQRLKQRLEA